MHGGHYVLAARRRAGLTQRELADRIGRRQATIARWERGDRHVTLDDVEVVAAACGLHFAAELVVADRSWWSQISLQLELDPLDRVRRLTPSGSPDLVAGLAELVAVGEPSVVIGRIAGALQGAPLMLANEVIEICADHTHGAAEYELRGGGRVRSVEAPPGTHGFADLWRGSVQIEMPEGQLRVASIVDLLRIADAATHQSARLEALAYQAVLDVEDARNEGCVADTRTNEERIEAWLSQQTPIKT